MWLTHHVFARLLFHDYMPPTHTHTRQSPSSFVGNSDNIRWGGGGGWSESLCGHSEGIHRDKTIGETQRGQQQTFHLLSFHQRQLLLLSNELLVSLPLCMCMCVWMCVWSCFYTFVGSEHQEPTCGFWQLCGDQTLDPTHLKGCC